MVDLKIKVTRRKQSFCLMTARVGDLKPDYKVHLKHVSLFIRKIKLSTGVSVDHTKAMEKWNAKYPIGRVLCKTNSIRSGSWSFMQNNVFLRLIPKHVNL